MSLSTSRRLATCACVWVSERERQRERESVCERENGWDDPDRRRGASAQSLYLYFRKSERLTDTELAHLGCLVIVPACTVFLLLVPRMGHFWRNSGLRRTEFLVR